MISQLKYPDLLKSIVFQFHAFLATSENHEIIKDDQKELGQTLELVADLEGDFNYHLKYQPQLLIFTSWFYNKYNGILSEVTRNCTAHYNLRFTELRSNGYSEWDAKRRTETEKEWLQQVRHQDKLQQLVNILKSICEACKERRSILESIANNYRAEVRGDSSTI